MEISKFTNQKAKEYPKTIEKSLLSDKVQKALDENGCTSNIISVDNRGVAYQFFFTESSNHPSTPFSCIEISFR